MGNITHNRALHQQNVDCLKEIKKQEDDYTDLVQYFDVHISFRTENCTPQRLLPSCRKYFFVFLRQIVMREIWRFLQERNEEQLWELILFSQIEWIMNGKLLQLLSLAWSSLRILSWNLTKSCISKPRCPRTLHQDYPSGSGLAGFFILLLANVSLT